jgi:hypothetical protein
MEIKLKKPKSNECNSYYLNYINKINDEDIIDVLKSQPGELVHLLSSFNEEDGCFSYAQGKWTVKEVLGHIVDVERIFSYRVLCISRGDKTAIPGFDQDPYVEHGNFNSRTLQSLIDEFTYLRKSFLLLIENFTEEICDIVGTANNQSVTVRALIFVMAGHFRHHFEVLKERYNANK